MLNQIVIIILGVGVPDTSCHSGKKGSRKEPWARRDGNEVEETLK